MKKIMWGEGLTLNEFRKQYNCRLNITTGKRKLSFNLHYSIETQIHAALVIHR